MPYSAFALAVAGIYARFLVRLPSATRTGLIVAGAIFVAGAAGMELIGRDLFDPDDIDATYLAAVGIEEVLELIGISVLIHTLLRHLRDHVGSVVVTFDR